MTDLSNPQMGELHVLTRVSLRRATIHDALLFYALRLDPKTRRFTPAFNTPLILEDHVTWFATRVWTASWFVAEENEQPVGIVRLDSGHDDRSYVSIIVVPSMRGRGIGLAMLQALAAAIPGPRYACIHHFNISSIRVFEQAGYAYTGEANGVWRVYRVIP